MPRRSTVTPRVTQSAPLPVSLTLYNLHVPNKDTDPSNNKRKLFRPQYTADLLVPARLDIFFASDSEQRTNRRYSTTPDDDEERDQLDADILLYSSTNNEGAIHPTWNHLDEQIEAFQEKPAARDAIYHCINCNVFATRAHKNSTEQVLLAQVPLHPSRLRRLPQEKESNNNDATVNYWEQRLPPKQLPPNAILIHFADGSTRVDPQLYHYLVEKNVIQERDPRDVSLIQDEEEEYKRRLRFDDTVFDTLDQVVWDTTDTSTRQVQKRPSPTSLLETDDESQAVVIKSLGKDVHGEFDSTTLVSKRLQEMTREDESQLSKTADLKLATQRTSETGSFLPIENESVIADLRHEKEELKRLLAEEDVCLQLELAALHEVSLGHPRSSVFGG